MIAKAADLAAQMDQLHEYERQPVDTGKLQGAAQFAGLYAGEHVAATEFVIGPFFVLHGVSAAEFIWGLLVGNLLAVLSWTLVCAPIATRTRLTLYWYLRKIAGPGLTLVYNVVNALLYCVLAGAMISVSASAVGIALGIAPPGAADVLPPNAAWAMLALLIGALFTLLAVLGFVTLSKFATVCAPWLFPIFIAGAIAMLPALGVQPDLSNFWEVAATKIWTGVPSPGYSKFDFWHVVFFAWFANLAMHIGLSDMAIFRYAPNWKYGLASTCGMLPGHFLAWICSGIMVAGINREMNPGLMAYEAAGAAGLAAVAIAGWTTANPTLYRAGLALQSITPNWSRWKVTTCAGIATSILACSPVFFLRLLDYVAIYGLVLMPIGAVVFAEHWLIPRIGVKQYRVEYLGRSWNWSAAITWVGTLVICFLLPVELFFKWLPGWFIAVGMYLLLSKLERTPA